MIPVLCTHVKALSLTRVEDALLADEWISGCVVWDYWMRHNAREIIVEPWRWETPPDPSKARTVSGKRKMDFVMPVPPIPMCPPETRVTVQYEVGLAHNEHGKEILHVKSSTVSHDVPYGDHFSVDEKIEMLREGDGVLVTKSWSADWVKRSFLKSMIERNVKNSQADTCEKLIAVLQAYADEGSPVDSFGSPMSRSPESDGNLLDLDGDEFMSVDGDDEDASFEDADGGEVEASTSLLEFLGDAFSTFTMSRWRPSRAQHGERIVFEVWELQRRTTMFHDDWRAPFLPHDGQKQARWVDDRYHKHPWVLMTSGDAAVKDRPPISGPAAMCEQEEWHVATEGHKDKEGWQYAPDFYKKPNKWGAKAAICLCRRRLWKCTFVRMPKVVQPRTIVLQIWELQRRTTIFQTDWRAPFLPHDLMRHRFRWVDLDYNAHPWFNGQGGALGACDTPPVTPPQGWEAEGWVVAHPAGPCDSGRWQYSSDLNRSSSRWGSQSTGLGCRRRLWSCIFTEGCRILL
ncbi:unnamed protein product [Durusdinium trenchii]|uniref:VASt domain-containing protein n=2 Tax=Durusdinium trenchii TaxID=1381693 RepID=A0ABP0I3T7_9DINO